MAVFDWFDVLAYPDDPPSHPNRLRAEYGGESGDSHPNAQANVDSTVIFADSPECFFDGALPAGDYVFYFAVDDNADGVFDATWGISVEVHAQ